MPTNIPYDKLLGFGLILVGIAASLIPGIELPAGAAMSMITGGIVLLGINNSIQTLGRKLGARD